MNLDKLQKFFTRINWEDITEKKCERKVQHLITKGIKKSAYDDFVCRHIKFGTIKHVAHLVEDNVLLSTKFLHDFWCVRGNGWAHKTNGETYASKLRTQVNECLSLHMYLKFNMSENLTGRLLQQLKDSPHFMEQSWKTKLMLMRSIVLPSGKADIHLLMFALSMAANTDVFLVEHENYCTTVTMHNFKDSGEVTIKPESPFFGFVAGYFSLVVPTRYNVTSLITNKRALVDGELHDTPTHERVQTIPLSIPRTSPRTWIYGTPLLDVTTVTATTNDINDIANFATSVMPLLYQQGIALVEISDFDITKPIIRNGFENIELPFMEQTIRPTLERNPNGFLKVTNSYEIVQKTLKDAADETTNFPHFQEDISLTTELQRDRKMLYAIGGNMDLFSKDSKLQVQQVLSGCFGAVLRDKHIDGINTFYNYVGMAGSIFHLHTEDHGLFSYNINLEGGVKLWFSISPNQFVDFTNYVTSKYQGQIEDTCNNRIQHRDTWIDPKEIHELFEVYYVVQRPGQAVVTMASAHHWGINVERNIAVAANFVNTDWLEERVKSNLCSHNLPDEVARSVFSGEEVLDILSNLQPGEFGEVETESRLSKRWDLLTNTYSSIPKPYITHSPQLLKETRDKKGLSICKTCQKPLKSDSTIRKHACAVPKIICGVCNKEYKNGRSNHFLHCARNHVKTNLHGPEKCPYVIHKGPNASVPDTAI